MAFGFGIASHIAVSRELELSRHFHESAATRALPAAVTTAAHDVAAGSTMACQRFLNRTSLRFQEKERWETPQPIITSIG